jgi:cyclopropane-fatty-acyl-phospholipid synthase
MKASIIPQELHVSDQHTLNRVESFSRKTVLSILQHLTFGRIVLREGDQFHTFGQKNDDFPLEAEITVHSPKFYSSVLFGGTVGAGRAYMDGLWSTTDLTALIRIIFRNQAVLQGMDRSWTRLMSPAFKLFHYLRRNTKQGSRDNIMAHYDLGNDFYQLFLDDTMTYSCGIFENEESTLRDASVAKYDRICRKLGLRPEDHVLEIGTGWGGFAIHAAKHYGCKVTTTTISQEQYDFAKQRVEQENLSDKIELLLKDYRDLNGKYDKLVSIEMIEAVGHQYYNTFFRQCSNLLKPDGMMLIQAITMADHAFDRHKHSVDFIKRYIFPGSCIPSVTALSQAMTKASDLRLFHFEDITPHYATTLRLWRERFFEKVTEVRELGYSETFIRMWDFYLSYCEAGFAERYLGDAHLLFTKPLCRQQPILPNL